MDLLALAGHPAADDRLEQPRQPAEPHLQHLGYLRPLVVKRLERHRGANVEPPGPADHHELLVWRVIGALLQAVELPDPVHALRQVIVAGTRIWATDPKLVPGLLWLAHAQPDATPVIRRLDSGRAAIMERLVQRLYDDGRLRHGLHQARAVDILVAATAFEGWDQLVTTRHRSPASTSKVIAELAVTAIMAPSNQGDSVARTSQSARRR